MERKSFQCFDRWCNLALCYVVVILATPRQRQETTADNRAAWELLGIVLLR